MSITIEEAVIQNNILTRFKITGYRNTDTVEFAASMMQLSDEERAKQLQKIEDDYKTLLDARSQNSRVDLRKGGGDTSPRLP